MLGGMGGDRADRRMAYCVISVATSSERDVCEPPHRSPSQEVVFVCIRLGRMVCCALIKIFRRWVIDRAGSQHGSCLPAPRVHHWLRRRAQVPRALPTPAYYFQNIASKQRPSTYHCARHTTYNSVLPKPRLKICMQRRTIQQAVFVGPRGLQAFHQTAHRRPLNDPASATNQSLRPSGASASSRQQATPSSITPLHTSSWQPRSAPTAPAKLTPRSTKASPWAGP